MSWAEVFNAAETAWKIIDGKKPTAEIDQKTCNAVPKVNDWTNLTGTQGPNILKWKLQYTNGFGIDVVLIRFELKWEYGARYNNGGAFIPNCWLHVPQCDVKWGYGVELTLEAHNPTNGGTDTAPNARLPITVSGSVDTPFWTDNAQWDFTLFGDGSWQQ